MTRIEPYAGRRRRTDQDPSQRDRADARAAGMTTPKPRAAGAPGRPAAAEDSDFPQAVRPGPQAAGADSRSRAAPAAQPAVASACWSCAGSSRSWPSWCWDAAEGTRSLPRSPSPRQRSRCPASNNYRSQPRCHSPPPRRGRRWLLSRPPPLATAAPVGAAPSTTKPGQTWTIMLYQGRGRQDPEQDIYIDLNEAERIGSSDRVNMVAQIDRYRGGFNADGNWTGTRRYVVRPDQDLTRVKSELVAEGELNMAAGETLADFIIWSAKNYPADKYVLVMSDHGMGWPGGWSDPDAGQQGTSIDRNVPIQAVGRSPVPGRAGQRAGDRTPAGRHRQVRAHRHGRLPDGPHRGHECAGRARPLRGLLPGDRAGVGLGLHRVSGCADPKPGHGRRTTRTADRSELHRPGRAHPR